jgi:PAS domain S-box-containing protein
MHATVEYPADPARTSGAPAVSEQAWKIMETALDATVLVDAELRIVAWNSTAEATFGWSREEALGREIVDLVPERLRGTYRLGLPAAMNPDSAIPALRTRFVTVAIRSDGEEFPIEEKIEAIATRVYGADGIFLLPAARTKMAQFTELGLHDLPICMAKTHLSLSDDVALTNAPTGFTVTVRDLRAYTGAGWIVALCGDMQTMPGLSSTPAAVNVDIDGDGRTVGLF